MQDSQESPIGADERQQANALLARLLEHVGNEAALIDIVAAEAKRTSVKDIRILALTSLVVLLGDARHQTEGDTSV